MMDQNESTSQTAGFSVIHSGSRFPSAIFDHAIIDSLIDILPKQSKDSVMVTFGISTNTWVKIKRGEPIRLSTAEQIVKRLRSKGWM